MITKATTTYYTIGKIILYVFCLNSLWLIFSAAGLVVAGVFPATYALFVVTRNVMRNPHGDVPLFKPFFKAFKNSFFKANSLGFAFTVILYAFVLTWGTLINPHGDGIVFLAQTVLALGMIHLLLSLILVFPLMAHFDISLKESFQWALRLPLIHPIRLLFMLGIIILGIGLLSIYLPFLVCLGMSILVFFVLWYLFPLLDKYEK